MMKRTKFNKFERDKSQSCHVLLIHLIIIYSTDCAIGHIETGVTKAREGRGEEDCHHN